MFANIYLYLPLIFSNGIFVSICAKRHVVEYDKLRFQPEIICNVVCEECLQISIYIYPLFSQLVINDMLLSMINSDFSLKSFVMIYVKNVCLQISIYIYPLFSQMVSRDMLLSMINSDFSQKSFVMMCEECLQISIYIYFYGVTHVVEYDIFSIGANIYLFLPLIFSKRHVVEYDKLRFQREIICNVVCEECLQISIYIYPLFSQMVSRDMLLSTINSDFSLKSFVMLYVKNVCKYHIYIYPLFSQMVSRDMLLSMINSDFSQKSFVMLCEECLQISIYFYPLFSQMVSHDMLLSMINSDFSEKSFVMLYVKNVCKYLFIFTPYFLKWCHATCCWV